MVGQIGGPVVKLSTQLAIVISVGIIGITGLVFGLAVLAHWSEGAIVAMISAFGALFVNTVVTVRNQAKISEVNAQQDEKLATIEKQTNGLSTVERHDIARRAAQEAVALAKRTGGL